MRLGLEKDIPPLDFHQERNQETHRRKKVGFTRRLPKGKSERIYEFICYIITLHPVKKGHLAYLSNSVLIGHQSCLPRPDSGLGWRQTLFVFWFRCRELGKRLHSLAAIHYFWEWYF
jgi:hypothetical protein